MAPRKAFYARNRHTGQLGLVMLPADTMILVPPSSGGGITAPSAPSDVPVTTQPRPAPPGAPSDVPHGTTVPTTQTDGGGGQMPPGGPITLPPTTTPPPQTVPAPVGGTGHDDAPAAPGLDVVAALSLADQRALYADLLQLGGPGGYNLRADWYRVFAWLRTKLAPSAGGPNTNTMPGPTDVGGGGGGGGGILTLPSGDGGGSVPQADGGGEPSAVAPSWVTYAAIAAAVLFLMRRR